MSLEQEELQSLGEVPEELKPCRHNSTKCATMLLSPVDLALNFDSNFPSSADNSFEITMHADNMLHIQQAANRLLEECLTPQTQTTQGFKDPSLPKNSSFEVKGDNELEALVTYNSLLNYQGIQCLKGMLQKEEGLAGLLRESTGLFGLTVAKELVYVIYFILRQKLPGFKKMLQQKTPLIPKFNCFQDCCQEHLCIMGTSCPVYEEVSLEEVGEYAEKDIQMLINQIYFSDIRILNLKEINGELKKGVNVLNKFGKFIRQVSRSVFLTLIGAAEPEEGAIDFSRQISLAQLSDRNLSFERSLSRPFVPYDEQESYDFLSKKIKF